jgi:hypothetical protein
MTFYNDATLDRIYQVAMDAHKLKTMSAGRDPEKYASSHSEMAGAIKHLRAKLAAAVAALAPFAKIRPSTLYAADGSEAEKYAVMLFDTARNKREWMAPDGPDFTGADLARARSVHSAPAQQKEGDK